MHFDESQLFKNSDSIKSSITHTHIHTQHMIPSQMGKHCLSNFNLTLSLYLVHTNTSSRPDCWEFFCVLFLHRKSKIVIQMRTSHLSHGREKIVKFTLRLKYLHFLMSSLCAQLYTTHTLIR